jgi:hypothetical protein
MSALIGKVETAWKSVISAFAGVPLRVDGETKAVYKGRESAELDRDRVVVECQGGPEEPRGSGNRLMKVRVAVFAGGDPDDETDPEETGEAALARNDALCGSVFEKITDKIGDGTLVPELNAAVDDFFVFEDAVTDEGEEPDIEGRGWVSARSYSVYCCGRDLS